jgi:hypothetical protein
VVTPQTDNGPDDFGYKRDSLRAGRSDGLAKKIHAKKCGVYYLSDGADILYIGSSRDVDRRVKEHRRAMDMDFAGYFYDEHPPEKLREEKQKAIDEFRPAYNYAPVIKFPKK